MSQKESVLAHCSRYNKIPQSLRIINNRHLLIIAVVARKSEIKEPATVVTYREDLPIPCVLCLIIRSPPQGGRDGKLIL